MATRRNPQLDDIDAGPQFDASSLQIPDEALQEGPPRRSASTTAKPPSSAKVPIILGAVAVCGVIGAFLALRNGEEAVAQETPAPGVTEVVTPPPEVRDPPIPAPSGTDAPSEAKPEVAEAAGAGLPEAAGAVTAAPDPKPTKAEPAKAEEPAPAKVAKKKKKKAAKKKRGSAKLERDLDARLDRALERLPTPSPQPEPKAEEDPLDRAAERLGN